MPYSLQVLLSLQTLVIQTTLTNIHKLDIKSISRRISLIENESVGYEELLKNLNPDLNVPVIGITGPPGAGKSTLTDALIEILLGEGKKVAILCVDPSSPFNKGALLGDRIRMSQWYNHPDVFIRSLASRGSLGGLNPKMIEITDFLRASGFDTIIIETVGVGQSEVEIASLADVTVVVLVPEAGDEIQTMKSGLMEIADIFVVNKADRPGADSFVKNLRHMMPDKKYHPELAPVVKTVASKREGIKELADAINASLKLSHRPGKNLLLLAERAYQLICRKKMTGISKDDLSKKIESEGAQFNMYRFIEKFH